MHAAPGLDPNEGGKDTKLIYSGDKLYKGHGNQEEMTGVSRDCHFVIESAFHRAPRGSASASENAGPPQSYCAAYPLKLVFPA